MSADAAASPAMAEVLLFFKALADETRLAIIRLLALTDLRAGELVERLPVPQNAVSYHLKQLRALRLLRDRRSSADARDIYYSLDWDRLQTLYLAAGQTLHPGILGAPRAMEGLSAPEPPLRILFLCTHNSARSQLAEGLLRYLAGDQVRAYSAGSDLAPAVHPEAVALLAEWGIPTTHLVPKSLDLFANQTVDYVITVCDRVRETCPVFPEDPVQIHWSIPDPSTLADPTERRAAFQEVRRELLTRLRYLLSLPHPVTGARFTLTPPPALGVQQE